MRDAAELALQLIGGEEVNRAMQMTKVLTAEIDDLIKVRRAELSSSAIRVTLLLAPVWEPLVVR